MGIPTTGTGKHNNTVPLDPVFISDFLSPGGGGGGGGGIVNFQRGMHTVRRCTIKGSKNIFPER